MKGKPQPLEFEFDDSSSMDDILGYADESSEKTDVPRKKHSSPLPPVNPLELPGHIDMEALLDGDDFSEPDPTPDPVETPGMPSDIFGTMDDGSMQELLSGETRQDIAEGHIIDIVIAGASVQLPDGRQGFLDKNEFPDWSQVQVGDTVRAAYSAESREAVLSLTLISHEARPIPRKESSPTQRPFDGFKPGTCFVLDGSNICRSFADSSESSLTPLLSLVNGIMEHEGRCICVFDANERYVLGHNRREPNSERLYEQILNDLSKVFIEAPATGTADDYLLKIAHRDRLAVISNDRYDKATDRHREQYPWLVPDGSRLIRGRVDGNLIRIPRLKLAITISRDLAQLVQSIKLKVLNDA